MFQIIVNLKKLEYNQYLKKILCNLDSVDVSYSQPFRENPNNKAGSRKNIVINGTNI